jgi:hypothetical protein
MARKLTPNCPNCGENKVNLQKKGWFKHRYACANKRCMAQGQVFAKRTVFGYGLGALGMTVAFVRLTSGGS